MNVPFRPIVSALFRNRAGAFLVAAQVAIALAVLVNAVYMVKQRIDLIDRPTGIDVDNIFIVNVTGFTKDFNYRAMLDQDITWLRSVPGVIGVTAANAVPLSGGGSSDYIKLAPSDKGTRENLVNYFHLNEQGAQALGLKVIAGRWFTKEEVQPPGATPYSVYTGPIVVT
jgi:putative ABC transport system permease protein